MRSELNELLTHPVVAAAVGAAVGLRAMPGATRFEKLLNVAAGFAIASWVGSAAVEYMEVTSPRTQAGIIFIIGATGLVLFNAIIEAIKRTDLGAWIGQWMPGRKGGG